MTRKASGVRAKFSDAKIAAIRRDGEALGRRKAARKHSCSAAYVSDLLLGKRRPAPLKIRALDRKHYELKTRQTWRNPFWYGDGEPATVPVVLLREADYRALRKAAGRRK